MRSYAAYSCIEDGLSSGAVLIIAHTVKEAKWLASQTYLSAYCEYFDLRVRWLRDESLLALADQDKLAQDVAHVVTDPVACESCKLWGYGVDADGNCRYCDSAAGEVLVDLLKKVQ